MSSLKLATSELADRRQLVAAQRADRLPGVGQAVLDQLAGTVDRGADLRARLLALGEHPRSLQLDRGCGERISQDRPLGWASG
jgi:hypothetical protein